MINPKVPNSANFADFGRGFCGFRSFILIAMLLFVGDGLFSGDVGKDIAKASEGGRLERPKDDTYGCLYLDIIDGDTIKVRYKGEEISVRLLGIDSPESKDNKKARKDSENSHESVKSIIRRGKSASMHLGKLLEPKMKLILLEFDKRKKDKYGRILAYVWFQEQMINLRMLEDGHAEPFMYEGLKYENEFKKYLTQNKEKP